MIYLSGSQPQLKSCLWFFLVLAVSQASLVTHCSASTPVTPHIPSNIQIPDECAYFPLEARANLPFSHICARDMLHLNNLLQSSTLKESCPDLTDFEQIGSGESYDDSRIKFIKWGNNRFLLRIMCQNAAYNTSYITLIYEPKIMVAKEITEIPINVFKLLVFPFATEDSKSVTFSPIIFMPYANFTTQTLYHHVKAIGAGTGGYYAKFGLDRQTLEPILLQAISKPFNDYKDPYYFAVNKIPTGKGWKSLSFPKGQKGLLLAIDRPDMNLDEEIASFTSYAHN